MAQEPLEFTRSDLYFAAYAGLFDGEGSIGMTPISGAKPGSARYLIRLRAQTTSRKAVSGMHAHFGVGTYRSSKRRPGRKQAWDWYCGKRRDVIRILQRFLDLKVLTVRAREAKLALEYLTLGELSDAKQDRIYRKMRQLKFRPKTSLAGR